MAGFSAYSWGGGDEETDDSGILRFVSNRYGGYIIALDTELNSFSGYGVGRNTVLEFLEAFNNADDDFEFWGGDVNLRYSISAFCGDDGLDTDQGYLGVYSISSNCKITASAPMEPVSQALHQQLWRQLDGKRRAGEQQLSRSI